MKRLEALAFFKRERSCRVGHIEQGEGVNGVSTESYAELCKHIARASKRMGGRAMKNWRKREI